MAKLTIELAGSTKTSYGGFGPDTGFIIIQLTKNMPNSLLIALIVIFAIHLVVFSRLAFKHKKDYHILLAITFFLLVSYNAQRLWWPGFELFGRPLYDYSRYGAWTATVLAMAFFIRHKWR